MELSFTHISTDDMPFSLDLLNRHLILRSTSLGRAKGHLEWGLWLPSSSDPGVPSYLLSHLKSEGRLTW